jgi:hypothetical protein
LIDNLTREGAKVIAFDVHFIEPRSPEDDNLFAKAISGAGNIILCEPLKSKEIQFSDNGSSYEGDHSIVKIVQPIAPFARAAAATAPLFYPEYLGEPLLTFHECRRFADYSRCCIAILYFGDI